MYDLAIQLNPIDADYYYNKGIMLFKKKGLAHSFMKKYDKASKYFIKP